MAKRSTKHLRSYKAKFKAAAKACKGRKQKAFRSCMKTKLKGK